MDSTTRQQFQRTSKECFKLVLQADTCKHSSLKVILPQPQRLKASIAAAATVGRLLAATLTPHSSFKLELIGKGDCISTFLGHCPFAETRVTCIAVRYVCSCPCKLPCVAEDNCIAYMCLCVYVSVWLCACVCAGVYARMCVTVC